MKFAIVGCGAIAWRGHLPALSKLEDVEVTSVVDLDKTRAKRTAKKFGVKKYYSTVDEILKDEELDVVVIATPTPTHKDLAIKVADAGKHIIVEKTLATRIHKCPKCGLRIDRDINAARNILNLALNTLGTRGINACGVEGIPLTLKQEALRR